MVVVSQEAGGGDGARERVSASAAALLDEVRSRSAGRRRCSTRFPGAEIVERARARRWRRADAPPIDAGSARATATDDSEDED